MATGAAFIPHLVYQIGRTLAFTDQPSSLCSQLEGCSLFQQGVENPKNGIYCDSVAGKKIIRGSGRFAPPWT